MSASAGRPRDRFLALVHPVTRLLCLLAAFVPPFFGDHPLEVAPYVALLLAVALLAGAGPRVRAASRLMVVLFLMSLVLWSFFRPGSTPLISLGPVCLARESVLYGATAGLRLTCFVLASLTFLACTPVEDLTGALTRLGVPYAAGFALSLAFRLTPLFLETGNSIAQAQRARGLDLDRGGPLRRLRSHLPILVPVLLCGLRRADQLAVALESRGFGREGPRTALIEYRLTWRDAVLVFATLLAGVLTWLIGRAPWAP